jgi:hypothetical protein
MTLGSESAMSTAPMEPPKKPSLMLRHDVPASSVFHIPPPVEPMRKVWGWAANPATAVERPPRKGPSSRNVRLLKRRVSCAGAIAAVRAGWRAGWAARGAAKRRARAAFGNQEFVRMGESWGARFCDEGTRQGSAR